MRNLKRLQASLTWYGAMKVHADPRADKDHLRDVASRIEDRTLNLDYLYQLAEKIGGEIQLTCNENIREAAEVFLDAINDVIVALALSGASSTRGHVRPIRDLRYRYNDGFERHDLDTRPYLYGPGGCNSAVADARGMM